MMIDYTTVGNLACFMIKCIAENPENRTEDGVNWDFVSSDVYLSYDGEFDDEMIEQAIDLIYEAAEKGEGPTLH